MVIFYIEPIKVKIHRERHINGEHFNTPLNINGSTFTWLPQCIDVGGETSKRSSSQNRPPPFFRQLTGALSRRGEMDGNLKKGEVVRLVEEEDNKSSKKEVRVNPKKLRFSPSIGPLALVQTTRLGVTTQHFEL